MYKNGFWAPGCTLLARRWQKRHLFVRDGPASTPTTGNALGGWGVVAGERPLTRQSFQKGKHVPKVKENHHFFPSMIALEEVVTISTTEDDVVHGRRRSRVSRSLTRLEGTHTITKAGRSMEWSLIEVSDGWRGRLTRRTNPAQLGVGSRVIE